MTLSKKIENYLVKNQYKYEVVPHRTTYTAWDTAQTEKVKPQEVAKALIMKIDSEYAVAMLPSNKNLDKQKLLKLINAGKKKSGEKMVKKIDFAKELWMKKNLPGKLGAAPPFADLLKIPVYFDKLLAKNKKIYLGSGEYTASIRMNVTHFLKIEKPMAGGFSMSKK